METVLFVLVAALAPPGVMFLTRYGLLAWARMTGRYLPWREVRDRLLQGSGVLVYYHLERLGGNVWWVPIGPERRGPCD